MEKTVSPQKRQVLEGELFIPGKEYAWARGTPPPAGPQTSEVPSPALHGQLSSRSVKEIYSPYTQAPALSSRQHSLGSPRTSSPKRSLGLLF